MIVRPMLEQHRRNIRNLRRAERAHRQVYIGTKRAALAELDRLLDALRDEVEAHEALADEGDETPDVLPMSRPEARVS